MQCIVHVLFTHPTILHKYVQCSPVRCLGESVRPYSAALYGGGGDSTSSFSSSWTFWSRSCLLVPGTRPSSSDSSLILKTNQLKCDSKYLFIIYLNLRFTWGCPDNLLPLSLLAHHSPDLEMHLVVDLGVFVVQLVPAATFTRFSFWWLDNILLILLLRCTMLKNDLKLPFPFIKDGQQNDKKLRWWCSRYPPVFSLPQLRFCHDFS